MSHSDRSNRETHWHVEREGDRIHLRSHHGGYLAAHGDGSFNARGERHHSHWHAERAGDGSVALKAHNVSWFLGVSMFGGAEAVELLDNPRCHFRVDVDVEGGMGMGVGVVVAQQQPQPMMVQVESQPMMVPMQPQPVVVMQSQPVVVVASPGPELFTHGAKVAFYNLGHMHFLSADFGGTSIVC